MNGEWTDENEENDIKVDHELLNELREAAKDNNGKYPIAYVINFLRDRLQSMPCRNQGYILDGFPNVLEEAYDLFNRKCFR